MTSTFILAQGEEFIQCPYNTAHQITNARLLTHLEKCRKAYLKDLTVEGRIKVMKICRHNALHHVPAPELNFHETRCMDSFSVVRHIAYHNSDEGNRRYEDRHKQDSERTEVPNNERPSNSSSSSRRHSSSSWNKPEAEVKPNVANSWGLEEEDWEIECSSSAAGYNPEIKLKTELVMYNPAGLTKSERKLFRTEVRQKAAEMSMKGEPVELPTTSNFDVKPNITDLRIKEEKAERSPPEPGEIDDDDDSNQGSDEHSRTSNGSRYTEDRQNNNDKRGPLSSANHRNSHDRQTSNGHRDPLSSEDCRNSHKRQRRLSPSSSSRHHSSSNSKSSYSRSNSYKADRFEMEKEEFHSDDFPGIDPYADT